MVGGGVVVGNVNGGIVGGGGSDGMVKLGIVNEGGVCAELLAINMKVPDATAASRTTPRRQKRLIPHLLTGRRETSAPTANIRPLR